MATRSVHLDFVPPDIEGMDHILIFESASSLGPWTEIDSVIDVGIYPNYISSYSTSEATLDNGWYAIEWYDYANTPGGLSNPIRFGTETIIGDLIKRVMRRDPELDEIVVAQEAESVMEWWFNKDPNLVTREDDFPATRFYQTMNGLMYLVMSRVMLAKMLQSSDIQQAAIGLVTFKADAGSVRKQDIDELVALANKELRIRTSAILQLESLCHRYGQPSRTMADWYTSIPYPIKLV